MYTFDAPKVRNECVQWIRDFFEQNGSGCNAVVGISGGKDSSIVAALCVEALGKDRVIGVLMPNGEQALNIVIKLQYVNGRSVAKLSDTPVKAMCRDADYLEYLKRSVAFRIDREKKQ